MKKILQIIIFLYSVGIFACICNTPGIAEKFTHSDFVAKAKIVKIYKNERSEELYKADILIDEIFKGNELESIYVAGRSDGKIGSSCSIFIPENTELIVYAYQDKEGRHVVGMCSGLLYLNNRHHKKQERELEILNMFKSKNISFTDYIIYREKTKLHKKLEQFKGIELEKSYGIYEVTFASNLAIKNVKEISGFNHPIDEKLIEIIKKTKWSSYNRGEKDSVPENSKMLLGIYYYPKRKENPSYLSQRYL